MWTVFAVIMFVVMVVLHELGHAFALRRSGIPICEAGLGLAYAPRLVLKPTKRRPFALSLSPWLVAAYVVPDPAYRQQMEAMSYRDKTWHHGAGIVVNLVIATGLATLVFVLEGHWWRALIAAAATTALWLARRVFTAYAVPALAVPTAAYLGVMVVDSIGEPAGYVELASILTVGSGIAMLQVSAVLSFALAVLNMAPIFPVDGGRICREIVQRWAGPRGVRIFETAGFAVVVGLVAYSLLSDLIWSW